MTSISSPRAGAYPPEQQRTVVLDTVLRRWPGPDAHMSLGEGCVDCFIGEPHVCPLLVWGHLTLVEDEFGAWHEVAS